MYSPVALTSCSSTSSSASCRRSAAARPDRPSRRYSSTLPLMHRTAPGPAAHLSSTASNRSSSPSPSRRGTAAAANATHANTIAADRYILNDTTVRPRLPVPALYTVRRWPAARHPTGFPPKAAAAVAAAASAGGPTSAARDNTLISPLRPRSPSNTNCNAADVRCATTNATAKTISFFDVTRGPLCCARAIVTSSRRGENKRAESAETRRVRRTLQIRRFV